MKVLWAPPAVQDRNDIWDYIATDSPQAAARIDALFSEAAARLARHAELGKPGRVSGTREWMAHDNYRVVYEISGESVWILALVHAARQWPPVRP